MSRATAEASFTVYCFFTVEWVICDYVDAMLAKPHGLLVGMSVCVCVCMNAESQQGVCYSGLA